MRTTSRTRWGLAALLTGALVATACGGDTEPGVDPTPSTDASPDDAGSPSEVDSAAFPVTISTATGDVTIEAMPERIVSLSATSTEVLFAIGAGDQVVAVDDTSDFPAEAPMTDLTGLSPNVEAITAYEPDLVFLSFDPGDVVSSLEAVGVPTIVHNTPAELAGAYTQIEQVGAATGHVADAAKLVAEMQSDIDALVADIEVPAEPLTYYHELDDTLYSLTSATIFGQVYGLFGLENIADAADEDGSAFGYPQLNAEYVVEADPDLIFLADAECCNVTAEVVAGRPGWDEITAVEKGAIAELDEDVASRWGPRLVEFARTVAALIEQFQTADAS